MEDLKADLKALITGMKQVTEAISRVHTGILQLAPALQACIDALPTKEEMNSELRNAARAQRATDATLA